MIWIEFIICSSLLIAFSYYLCKEGTIISEKTHIEEGIIGMFFLAIATSFPEIVTSAASVFPLGKIGLGYGDLIGSIIVNFMILIGLDFCIGKGRVLRNLSSTNKLTSIFLFIICFIVMFFVFLHRSSLQFLTFRGVGIEMPIIICVYFFYLRLLHKKGVRVHVMEVEISKNEPFLKIWTKFILLLLAIMFLGIWMARIGNNISIQTGMSETFIGTLFLGVVTSFPEIIVSFSAIRVGSVNMAVGNVLGSNLFDICIVPLLDVLYDKPVLSILSTGQVISTCVVLFMAVVAVMGLRSIRQTSLRVNWDTGFIFITGLASFVLLYYIK